MRRQVLLIVAAGLSACAAASDGDPRTDFIAHGPVPADGAERVPLPVWMLSWKAGATAAYHRVYFGATPDLSPEVFVVAAGDAWPPMDLFPLWLLPSTAYYWRVDAVEEDGTVHAGDVWSFTTAPRIAHGPAPHDGEEYVDPDAQLSWATGAYAADHDLYFGTDEEAVAGGEGDTFKGRHASTTFAPARLEPRATYYWRVDAVRPDGTVFRGVVWKFTATDFIVVDDFESYTNERWFRISDTWIDGACTPEPTPGCPPNGSSGWVGHDIWSLDSPHYGETVAETEIVHGGKQSMPLYCFNDFVPWYSEVYRCYFLTGPQDWTVRKMNTLSVWLHGDANNPPDPLYVAIEDEGGRRHRVVRPDPNAAQRAEWFRWDVDLAEFADGGVDLTVVAKLHIGVGDMSDRKPSGQGLIYIDDIRLLRVVPRLGPNDVVIDDFECYTNEARSRVFETWLDGCMDCFPTAPWPCLPEGCSTAFVGHDIWSPESPHHGGKIVETDTVHGGQQSMPLYYDDSIPPYYSETQRRWKSPEDWTCNGLATLRLHLHGRADNDPAVLYVAVRDDHCRMCVCPHPDPNVVLNEQWQQWDVSLDTIVAAGVDLNAVMSLHIGVGDRDDPQPGGKGLIYVDDVQLIATRDEIGGIAD